MEQTEDELLDLVEQIVTLAQTMTHSTEEAQRMTTLQEQED